MLAVRALILPFLPIKGTPYFNYSKIIGSSMLRLIFKTNLLSVSFI